MKSGAAVGGRIRFWTRRSTSGLRGFTPCRQDDSGGGLNRDHHWEQMGTDHECHSPGSELHLHSSAHGSDVFSQEKRCDREACSLLLVGIAIETVKVSECQSNRFVRLE